MYKIKIHVYSIDQWEESVHILWNII